MAYQNLSEIIDNTIRLGYGISFDIFGNQLRLIIYKSYNGVSETTKIQQVVPLSHLSNLNKMNNLINYMIDRISIIQESKNNEINRTND